MAEPATVETTQFAAYPPLALVTELQPEPFVGLIDADTIPELAFARRRASTEAARILGINRRSLIDNGYEAVSLPVDALGTATRVLEAEATFGTGSPEHIEADAGLLLDSSRLLGEAARKGAWEYFAETKQSYDAVAVTHIAHGVPTRRIVEGGLSPLTEPEEEGRRANEYVEEVTYNVMPRIQHSLGHLGLKETVSVTTISECTYWAISAYKRNSKASHGGYVPEIEKFMVRGVRFDAIGDRYEEQLGLSGKFITRDVIRDILAEEGGLAAGAQPDKTELHGKQFLSNTSEGVIGLAQKLDTRASEVSGLNIFMGEVVPEDHLKDYSAIPVEAEARREKLAAKSGELKDAILLLERKHTDHSVAEGLVGKYVQKVLLEVASNDPDQAEVIFDQETADGFREVIRLREQGRHQEAQILKGRVESNAPAASYCGAGSCGLESVLVGELDYQIALELGLRGEVLHDTERPCPSCHEMKVHYDMRGGKACTACGYNNTGAKKSKDD